jgi:DNA-binding CsgD family transcriptional regulator
MLHTLVRLGDTERARQALADLGEQDRQRGEILIAEVTLRLAQDDPQAATPAPPGAPWSARSISPSPTACSCGSCCTPAPGLLERHAWQPAAHAALPAEIRSLLAGRHPASPPAGPQPPLSNSEIRVLRSLPANLSMPEIASELYVSLNTIRTHMRNLYAKLGTHRRAGAAARARAPGLLATPRAAPWRDRAGAERSSGPAGQPEVRARADARGWSSQACTSRPCPPGTFLAVVARLLRRPARGPRHRAQAQQGRHIQPGFAVGHGVHPELERPSPKLLRYHVHTERPDLDRQSIAWQ